MAGKPRAGVAADHKVMARLTPGESAALTTLRERFAAKMEAAGMAGDQSFAAWLRMAIRHFAAEENLTVESPHAAPPARPRAKTTRKGGR